MVQVAPTFDARTVPAYSYAQASRLLGIPSSTVRAWKKGQRYTYRGEDRVFEAPIPASLSRGLSYFDLVETFVLRSLRVEHRYPIQYIREALNVAWQQYGIERLFLHRDFRYGTTEFRDFFVDRYTHLASLSRSKQLAMREVLASYLHRIGHGPDKLARFFYPIPPNRGVDSSKIIILNPTVSFGRPIIERVGIRTRAIADRIDVGEEPDEVCADYGIEPEELAEAINFEAA